MPKPRVFISSTFFDLRHVREDTERFVRELGYEPIRHEVVSIPYSKEQRLEPSAYREVDLSDIIVTIIGGRFGTESKLLAHGTSEALEIDNPNLFEAFIHQFNLKL